MDVAKYFRLDKKNANQIKASVIKAVSNWKKIAEKFGISKIEQELMNRAFYKE